MIWCVLGCSGTALYFKSHATAFCIILYRSSWASLCVFRILCGVCTLVVSEIIWVVSSIISVAASSFIHDFAIVFGRQSRSAVRALQIIFHKTLAIHFGFIVQTPD